MRASVGSCRRTTASLVVAVIALALLVVAGPAQAADCGPYADAQPGSATPDQISEATICLLNEQRAAYGLAPLTASAPLADTAAKYSAYMVSDEHFAHQDESGHNVVWRVLQTDPNAADEWDVIGENLGWGTYGMATPRAMVNGWMNSPTHRDNILYAPFDKIGVGVADGAPEPDRPNALTYATVFGKEAAPAQPAPAVAKKHHKARRTTSCQKRAKRARSKAARVRVARACTRKARAARARAAGRS